MARARLAFVCQSCGAQQPRWLGRCPQCAEWNTLVEEAWEPDPRRRERQRVGAQPLRLEEIPEEGGERVQLGLGELSRVLGGGVVPGSLVLLGGDPGIGKSTLLLQLAHAFPGPVLYVSGEESPQQVRMRARRLGLSAGNLYLLAETRAEAVLEQVRRLKPGLLVIDSIQTMESEELASAAGSIGQVRACAQAFQELAKVSQLPVFLVGHVTKEGAIAGPRVLEHLVDTVLYLEGEEHSAWRILRGTKNRFGSTQEVGVFEMGDRGLSEVANPSAAFLSERRTAPGSAVAITLEGTRPLLVEVQALTAPTRFPSPRVVANGVERSRLLMLLAVLARRAGLGLGEQDVYVSVTGGLRIREPAADLPLAAAIASALAGRELAEGTALVGEVGLSGELRRVRRLGERLREAAQLGFRRCILPRGNLDGLESGGLEVLPAADLEQALRLALDASPLTSRRGA